MGAERKMEMKKEKIRREAGMPLPGTTACQLPHAAR
jgi:hypothetical protein